jgi:hypothetical protein
VKPAAWNVLSVFVVAGAFAAVGCSEPQDKPVTPPPGAGSPTPGTPSMPVPVTPTPGGENPTPTTPPSVTPTTPPPVTPTPTEPPTTTPTTPPAGPLGAPLGKGNPASMGLDRHDALYCGEWQKTTKPGDTIYLIRGGKVVWSYSLNSSGGNEYGDCTLTSYGTVTYPLKNSGAFEMKVTEGGKGSAADIVWQYKQDAGNQHEVHSVQPIGKDQALVMQNGNPAKLMLIDKMAAKVCTSDNMACVKKLWNPDSGGSVHGMFRHVRMIANGNLLVPYTGGGGVSSGHVIEYTQDWKVVWDYNVKDAEPNGSPWAALRLPNGNTLISGNGGGWLIEVGPDKKVVWKIEAKDLPFPVQTIQGAMRLANGNTLVNNWCGPLPVGEWGKAVQAFEITPEKKVVWQVNEWANPNLGPGSSTQLLDEPGTPEDITQRLF